MWQLLPFVSQWWQCAIGGPCVPKMTEDISGRRMFWIKQEKGSLHTPLKGQPCRRIWLSFRTQRMPSWIDDKHKMEMRDQLVCVGKDTFFPNGVESHLFVAFSPNTADCTVLKKKKKMLLCWKKSAHQLAASNDRRSCYWFCMEETEKSEKRLHSYTPSSLLTCHINHCLS